FPQPKGRVLLLLPTFLYISLRENFSSPLLYASSSAVSPLHTSVVSDECVRR
ncbi:hypothetical protein CSUI_005932, partial [Cystoisospora suis]